MTRLPPRSRSCDCVSWRRLREASLEAHLRASLQSRPPAVKAKGAGIAIAVDAKGVIDISACSWSDHRDDGSAEGEGSGGEGVEGHDGEVIVESPSGSG